MRTLTSLRIVVLAAALLLVAACSRKVIEPHEAVRHVGLERGYDALHYDLEFEVRPRRPTLDGIARLELKVVRALDALELDAVDMQIEGVQVSTERPDGRQERLDREGDFRYDGWTLAVRLDRTVAAGEVVLLEVDYRTHGIAGMHFVRPEDKGVGPPHVFTQGECEAARYWFPCNDQPADRASHTITATVPSSWTTVAAGQRVDHRIDEGGLTATDRWVLEQEMPTYLFTFAAGPFVRIDDAWEDVEVYYLVEAADRERGIASFARTPDVLRFMSEETGFRYPFSKYSQTAVRDFPYGGMENVSATTVTREALRPEHLLDAFPTWGLVAHEAAHQWFGDVVTCETWPHAWLNEGFATYYALLYAKEAFGEGEFLYGMGTTIDSYTAACRGERLRAVVKSEYRAPLDLFFDGTIYPGGAARLNLLRGWVGDEAYRRSIRTYLEDNAYQSVTTESLRAAFEKVTGEDLSTFFEQWIYSPGYPEIEVEWSSDKEGGLQVAVRQTQDATTGVPQTFQFPLDVAWLDSGGWHESRIWVTVAEGSYQLPSEGSIRLVEVDPDAFLPARIRQIEPPSATRARLLEGRSSRSRALAVQGLREFGGQQVEEALWSAATGDAVPGVRREAATALLGRLDASDAGRVLGAYREEAAAGPRQAWVEHLAQWPGEQAAASFLEDLLDDEAANPTSRALALRTLAGQKSARELRSFLMSWTEKESEGDLLRAGALRLLAENFPDNVTRATLVGYTQTGLPTPTRVHAIQLLGPWLEQAAAPTDTVVVAVGGALRARSPRLRMAAASVVTRAPQWFEVEIRRMLRSEPDTRIRRMLETGMEGFRAEDMFAATP